MSTNNEPAFVHDRGGPYKNEWSGISVRDYFAARAMQSALVNASLPGMLEREPETMAVIGKLAEAMYAIADAMMAARERA